MVSEKFEKTIKRSGTHPPESTTTQEVEAANTRKLLKEALLIQKEINTQFKAVKRDYRKNKNIYDTLHNELTYLRKKREKPKFDKLINPYDRLRGNKGEGGLLGSLMSAFGLSGMFFKPLMKMFTKGIGQILKGVQGALKNLLRQAGKHGIKGIRALGAKGLDTAKELIRNGKDPANRGIKALGKLGSKGVRSAISGGARLAGRAGMRQVAGLIGRGVIGAAGAAIGYPLLIAAAGAAVGYGTYKLGRYLKLSEKLDSFIKKVSNGKFNSLTDFILGVADGTVGKELYGWVKDKISTMFTDSLEFLKVKTSEILGKLSPFPQVTDDSEAAGGDKSVVGGEGAQQLSANKSSGDNAARATENTSDSNEPAQQGTLWDRLKTSAGSAFQSVKDAVTGSDSSSMGADGSSISSDLGGSDLAWKAITGGKNTRITSQYRTAHRPKHDGIDIAADIGTPIYAVEDGVFTSNWHDGGGLQGFVAGESGYTYGVAHLSKALVKSGQKVKKGTKIALSGNSGANSSGPHIHFGMRKNGVRINPNAITVPLAKSKKEANAGIGDMVWPGDENKKPKTVANLASNFISNVKSSINSVKDSHTGSVSMNNHGREEVEEENSILNAVKKMASGKEFPGLAKSFNNISPSNTQQQAPSNTPKPSPKMMAPPSSAQAGVSKSGAISGQAPGIKDPRGALNSDIVLACTSPLFL